ncbi:MAG: hypothetical protein LBL76_01525 [Treponema sp.]|jgi:hypothetical protein|nr:hypothetical protein [Treponema sp.]
MKSKEETPSPASKPLDRELVFYYSREHRLERASPAVREMNRDIPKTGPWKSGTLSSNRASVMLLISILVCSGFIMIFSKVSSGQGTSRSGTQTSNLGGNTLRVSARKFQGTTYLQITKTVSQTPVYTGVVAMAITPLDSPGSEDELGESPPVVSHQIVFSADPEEVYGLSLPFEASQLLMLMQAGDDTPIRIQVKPE